MNRMRSRMLWICFTILSLMLVSCARALQLESTKTDSSPRLVIMSAFEPELTQLRSQTRVTNTYVINGRTYYLGELAGKDILLVLSGVSMVNAAMTAQTVIDHFDVSGIVFSGIAGGVNPNLAIGDVVVPAQWGEYQEQTFARETGDGWDAGEPTTEFENYGMMFPQSVSLVRK